MKGILSLAAMRQAKFQREAYLINVTSSALPHSSGRPHSL